MATGTTNGTLTAPTISPSIIIGRVRFPGLDSLDFTAQGCSGIAQFLKGWEIEDDFSPDLEDTITYFRGALPNDFSPRPADGQLIEWYRAVSNPNGTFYEDFKNYAIEQTGRGVQDKCLQDNQKNGEPRHIWHRCMFNIRTASYRD